MIVVGERWIRSCPLATSGTLEVEVLGPGHRPGSVRLRATNLLRGRTASWEIPEGLLRRRYVRGRVLGLEKLFGGCRRA